MDSLLSAFTHLNILHALVGSAFVFTLSSLYWVRAFKPNWRKTFSIPKRIPLSNAHRQPDASQEPISKGGAKKLAPVADSVWYFLTAIYILIGISLRRTAGPGSRQVSGIAAFNL